MTQCVLTVPVLVLFTLTLKRRHVSVSPCFRILHLAKMRWLVIPSLSSLSPRQSSSNSSVHRVGRVLSFFSSRRNWDSPTPSPAGECALLWFRGGGAHSLAGEGVGESQFRRVDLHCGTLHVQYALCGSVREPYCEEKRRKTVVV